MWGMKNHENCSHIQSCCCLKTVHLYSALVGLQLQGLSKVYRPHNLKLSTKWQLTPINFLAFDSFDMKSLQNKFGDDVFTSIQRYKVDILALAISIYTVLHIFRQVLFGGGNQSNHQNFDLYLLFYNCWLIFIGMKQKKIKKTKIFNSPNSQHFFAKISGIGPWVSRINWCQCISLCECF